MAEDFEYFFECIAFIYLVAILFSSLGEGGPKKKFKLKLLGNVATFLLCRAFVLGWWRMVVMDQEEWAKRGLLNKRKSSQCLMKIAQLVASEDTFSEVFLDLGGLWLTVCICKIDEK